MVISCAGAGTYEELLVSMVKGVPLEPAIARDVAAAILQAALDEEDAASPRYASLGRMLRYIMRAQPSRWDTCDAGHSAHPPFLRWSA